MRPIKYARPFVLQSDLSETGMNLWFGLRMVGCFYELFEWFIFPTPKLFEMKFFKCV